MTIFVLKTTANREDQVMDFLVGNAEKKKLEIKKVDLEMDGIFARKFLTLVAFALLDMVMA